MVVEELRIGMPFGEEAVEDDALAHNCGEPFFEVEIVPLRHCCDVTEPHVGDSAKRYPT